MSGEGKITLNLTPRPEHPGPRPEKHPVGSDRVHEERLADWRVDAMLYAADRIERAVASLERATHPIQVEFTQGRCQSRYQGIYQCQALDGHAGRHRFTSSDDGRSVDW